MAKRGIKVYFDVIRQKKKNRKEKENGLGSLRNIRMSAGKLPLNILTFSFEVQNNNKYLKKKAVKCSVTLAGAGLQHTPAEGLPERGDALGDALPGRFLLPVAGQRPPGQEREGVQVRGKDTVDPNLIPFLPVL